MFIRRGLALAASLLLSACGGGGDGGGNEVFRVSTNELVVTDTLADYNPPPTAFGGSVSNASGTTYILIEQTDNALQPVYFEASYDVAEATFHVGFKQFMPPGFYEDVIRVYACADSQCKHQLRGSPQLIHVTYNHLEGGAFTTNPDSIEVTAIAGVTPEMPVIDLDYSEGGVESWSAQVTYASGSDWLSLDLVGGQVSELPQYITPAITPILPPGDYQADVEFSSNGGTLKKTVSVLYHVAIPRSDPTTLDFTADLQSTAETLTRQVGLLPAFNDAGASSSSWSATADVPWLQITPAAGESFDGATMSVAVVPSALSQLDYGDHSATIRVQGQSGISDLMIPVRLAVRLPRVQYAAPYVVGPQREGELILRGHGFTAAAGLPLDIGGTELNDYTVIDDTRIELHHPGFAAGEHPIRLRDPFGGNLELARLISRAPIPAGEYPYQNVSIGYGIGNITKTVEDSARQARFHVHTYQQGYAGTTTFRLSAQRFDGATWANEYVELPSYPRDLFLSPDGRELLVVMGREIQHRDPETLGLIASSPLAARDGYHFENAALFNDGRLLAFGFDTSCGCSPDSEGETARWYDTRSRKYARIQDGTVPAGAHFQNRLLDKLYVSGNEGSFLLDEHFNALASWGFGSGSLRVLGMGDGPRRMLLPNSSMITIGDGAISGETISIYGEEPVLVSHDDQRFFYWRQNQREIVARDMTQPGFPVVGTAVMPFQYLDLTLSHDGTQLYNWLGPTMFSAALP